MLILAIALASASVVLSVVLPIALRDGSLRSAFQTLQDEFEDLRDHVRASLGRIDRLKRRGTLAVPPSEAGEPSQESADSQDGSTGFGLSARQQEINNRILRRRAKV